MAEQLNEQGSLQLIGSMINKARNNFNESGTLYLLWGFVILLCSLTQFIAVYFFRYGQAYHIWYLTWVAAIFQVVYLMRERRKRRVYTYADDILKYIWICFIICMGILVFVLGYQKSNLSILPAILVMYGMPTFLAGNVLKFDILKYGGICCWVLAFGCVIAPPAFQLLFISAAVILAWIIPGIYLRKKFLNENKKNGR